MTSPTIWRRAALKSRASVSGSVGAAADPVRASRTSRTRSPSHVPPGSRVRRTRHAASGEVIPEALGLGRLAPAVGAVDGDERAVTGGRRAWGHRRECSGRPSRGRHHPVRRRPRTLRAMGRDRTTCRPPARSTVAGRRRGPRAGADPRGRGGASARQLHDQPLRGGPRRAGPRPPRRRHRPGGDRRLPVPPGLRPRRGRIGLGRGGRGRSGVGLRGARRRPAPDGRRRQARASDDRGGAHLPARGRRPLDDAPRVRLRSAARGSHRGRADPHRVRRRFLPEPTRLAGDRGSRVGGDAPVHPGRARARRACRRA